MIEKKKRGFTLIELLAVIVILGMVAIITISIISVNLKDTKTTLSKLSINNILKTARDYVTEENILWTKHDDNEIVCITVGDLVDKGFFKNSNIKNLDKNLEDVIALTRNNDKIIVNEEYIDYNNIKNSICAINDLPGVELSISNNTNTYSDWYIESIKISAIFTNVKENNYYQYQIEDELGTIIINSDNTNINQDSTLLIHELKESGKYKFCLKVGNNKTESSYICTDLLKLDVDKPIINGIENIQLLEGQNKDIKNLFSNLTLYDEISGIDESSKTIIKEDENIRIISNTNELSVGTNILKYSIKDIAGNETQEEININIKPTPNVTTSYFCTQKKEYYNVLEDGYYQIIGNGSKAGMGGYGAYIEGIIYLEKGTKLEIDVGCSNGYNGGGASGGSDSYNGGGATTIKIDNEYIYIAAGGGGGKIRFNLVFSPFVEISAYTYTINYENMHGGTGNGKAGIKDVPGVNDWETARGSDGINGGGGASSHYYDPGSRPFYGIPEIPSIETYVCGEGGTNYISDRFISSKTKNGINNDNGNLKIVHVSNSNFANNIYYSENITDYEITETGIYEISIKGGKTSTSKGDIVSGTTLFNKGDILNINIGDQYGTNNGNTVVKFNDVIIMQAGGALSPMTSEMINNPRIGNNTNDSDGELSIINLGSINQLEFYQYKGDKEYYSITTPGYYYLEAYGAQGYTNGGKGGIASGIIYLNKNDRLEINVGGQTGYNGGGEGYNGKNGGGATHIKLNSNLLLTGAGGGGGLTYSYEYAAGGTSNGINNKDNTCNIYVPGCYNGTSGIYGGGAGANYYISERKCYNTLGIKYCVPRNEGIISGRGGANYTASSLIKPVKKNGKNIGDGKAVIEYLGDSYE